MSATAPPGRRRSPVKRRLTRTTKVASTLILVLALLEGTALTTRYLLTDHRWVSVDNAQVDGDHVEIRAPADGRITGWTVATGSTVTDDQVVGRVEILGGAAVNPRMPIRSPGRGTIAQNTVNNGMYVTAGSLLATAYDLSSSYVTARVPEDDIRDVHLGAAVDILVDASSGSPVTGTVSTISGSSAGVNALSSDPGNSPYDLQHPVYPGRDVDPQNPHNVKQYIPVKILFTRTADARLLPGQSVTVHIHRH